MIIDELVSIWRANRKGLYVLVGGSFILGMAFGHFLGGLL